MVKEGPEAKNEEPQMRINPVLQTVTGNVRFFA
jgi:hypothetical protein